MRATIFSRRSGAESIAPGTLGFSTHSASYRCACPAVSSLTLSARNSHSNRGSFRRSNARSSKIGVPSARRLSRVMPTRNLSVAMGTWRPTSVGLLRSDEFIGVLRIPLLVHLAPVPHEHALLLEHVVVNLLEILERVRLAGGVRMDRDRE